MRVRHPQYGVAVVKALTADISFDDARRAIAPGSSKLTPAKPTAAVSELQVPLSLANHGVAARQNRFRSK